MFETKEVKIQFMSKLAVKTPVEYQYSSSSRRKTHVHRNVPHSRAIKRKKLSKLMHKKFSLYLILEDKKTIFAFNRNKNLEKLQLSLFNFLSQSFSLDKDSKIRKMAYLFLIEAIKVMQKK